MRSRFTSFFPLCEAVSATFPHAADELGGDRLYVLIQTVGRGGCSLRGRLTVCLQPLQVQLSQLLEESVPLLLTQLRPKLQDVRLPRALQTLLHLLQRKHFGVLVPKHGAEYDINTHSTSSSAEAAAARCSGGNVSGATRDRLPLSRILPHTGWAAAAAGSEAPLCTSMFAEASETQCSDRFL